MKDKNLYGNCKPLCGLIAPFLLNILSLYFLTKFTDFKHYYFMIIGSTLFLVYLFLFFIMFKNNSIKNFIYFDNFEKTKEKKNGITLFLSFFFQLITLYIII